MSELSTVQAFEDRIRDRLRSEIGDLIPDELLKALIEKSINLLFFKPREVRTSSYSPIEVKPSWFQEEVEKLLQKRIQQLLEDYIKEHETEIKAEFTKILETKGPQMIASFFIDLLINQQQSMMWNFKDAIQQAFQDKNL